MQPGMGSTVDADPARGRNIAYDTTLQYYELVSDEAFSNFASGINACREV
jgi:hypothetical protein